MIDYGGGMPSDDGIAAAFPHKILEKINVTPSCIDIDERTRETDGKCSITNFHKGKRSTWTCRDGCTL